MQAATRTQDLRQWLARQGVSGETAVRHPRRTFVTGLRGIDELAKGGFVRGAVHEILQGGAVPPVMLGMLLARAAAAGTSGVIVVSDPRGVIYPPALAGLGVEPERVWVLRVTSPVDEVWALAECLRCKGVAAVLASPGKLGPVEARRLQLAAECGGGIGVLLRRRGMMSTHYAAATRWIATPARGDERVQRWMVALVHGHGRLTERSVVLEVCRGTNHVRAVDGLGDRSGTTAAATGGAPAAARASA